MEQIIRLLTEEANEDFYEIVFTNKDYVKLDREYQKCFSALEEAVPEEKQQAFLQFEITQNAVIAKEIELFYQRGVQDGIELMKSLWK